jgi:hypothetical protein
MTEHRTLHREPNAGGGGGQNHIKDRYKEIRGTITTKTKKKTINLYMPFYTEYSDVSLISRFYIHL